MGSMMQNKAYMQPGFGGNLMMQQQADNLNYEESIRKLENTEDAMKQKALLRKCSLKGAMIDVRLFVGQVPRSWKDENVLKYFKNFGTILDAKIIRDKFDGTHRGCAFLKCASFHEAEIILKNHLPRGKED